MTVTAITMRKIPGEVYHMRPPGARARCRRRYNEAGRARARPACDVPALPYSRLPISASTASRISQDFTSAFIVLWSG